MRLGCVTSYVFAIAVARSILKRISRGRLRLNSTTLFLEYFVYIVVLLIYNSCCYITRTRTQVQLYRLTRSVSPTPQHRVGQRFRAVRADAVVAQVHGFQPFRGFRVARHVPRARRRQLAVREVDRPQTAALFQVRQKPFELGRVQVAPGHRQLGEAFGKHQPSAERVHVVYVKSGSRYSRRRCTHILVDARTPPTTWTRSVVVTCRVEF